MSAWPTQKNRAAPRARPVDSTNTNIDTIAAVATAPGRAALAIVRMSGPKAIAIARRVFTPWPEAARRTRLARVSDTSGALIDEGLLTYYEAPASFTGEDLVEFTCHGGPLASGLIVAAFAGAGARPAEPGEFTRRAVLNGKLDLLQAEAVGDMADATSRAALTIAMSQLDGGLSRRINALRERIIEVEALAAYDIDFPEEDDGPIAPDRILKAARDVIAQIDALVTTAPVGELIREGACVVIAGSPNVGKSSLFNAMLGRQRAIVTPIPGTTRDALEALTEAGGWPIRLVDTAGLRESDDTVERLGIEVSRSYLGRASVVLACGDTSEALTLVVEAIESLSGAPIVRVHTKADLLTAAKRPKVAGAVCVSAESGEGLADVAGAIATALSSARGTLQLDAPVITRERHRFALTAARAELEEFAETFEAKRAPAVVAAVHLREATRILEELVGSVDVEDVLTKLFSSFCVGK
jgi:tRNA modification GTPase